MALIQVGSDAPDIQAKTGSGKDFRLGEKTGETRVMLVFYPRDFTPGCTTQLVNVQRSLSDMRAAGVEPYGVNPDDAESHEKFCDAYELQFDLLVDADKAAATAYGALKPEGGILRSVFVIGRNGKVIYAAEGAPAWDDVAAAISDVDDNVAVNA